MLKKLFIHEWKDTWKLMTILNVAVLVLALSGMIIFNNESLNKVFEESSNKLASAAGIGYASYIMVYVVGIVVLSIVSIWYFFIRFYQNLYTDQGYLMHTLPVTCHELIWSKTFVAIIWRFISVFVCTFAVVGVLASAADVNVFTEMAKAIEEIKIDSGKAVIGILLLLIGAVAGTLFDIYQGYLAISIGQQISKNKVLASIGIYVGISVGIRIVLNVLIQGFTIPLMMNPDYEKYLEWFENGMGVLVIMFIADLITCAACAGFYLLIHSFMKNKLNLD